jgi:hypothetical protein
MDIVLADEFGSRDWLQPAKTLMRGAARVVVVVGGLVAAWARIASLDIIRPIRVVVDVGGLVATWARIASLVTQVYQETRLLVFKSFRHRDRQYVFKLHVGQDCESLIA